MARKRTKTTIKNNCDRLVRECIRLRDVVCQRCGCSINLQCAHVKVRKYNVTRWDLLNLLLLCGSDPASGHEGCHDWFDKHHLISSEWFKEKFPERHQHISDIERNWQIKTWRVDDFLEVENYLKDKLKDLRE